jgi:hypothetical protein
MAFRFALNAFLLTGIIFSPGAKADLWGDVVNTVTAPVRAPIQATQDVLHGASPGTIIQNQLNIRVAPQAHVAQQAVGAVERGHNIITSIPRNFIQNQMGGDWLRGYDVLTASNRVQFEIGMTSGRFLGSCVQNINNCDIQHLTAVPVAAAMRDAYRVYVTYSDSLSPQLISVLSRVVPIQVLTSARWAVGNLPDLTAPGFINAANNAFGSEHAVTLANVMIFSEMPDLSTAEGAIWLLHELFHIEQYMRYSSDPLESIDGFATDYVTNNAGMEYEARSNADTRFRILTGR